MNVIFRMFNKRQINFFTATGDTGGAFLFRLIGGLDTLVFLLFLMAGGSVMEGEGSAAE